MHGIIYYNYCTPGTINYTSQSLLANPQSATDTKTWSSITGMVDQTADATAAILSPIGAVRTVVNSYSASATCIMTIMEN